MSSGSPPALTMFMRQLSAGMDIVNVCEDNARSSAIASVLSPKAPSRRSLQRAASMMSPGTFGSSSRLYSGAELRCKWSAQQCSEPLSDSPRRPQRRSSLGMGVVL